MCDEDDGLVKLFLQVEKNILHVGPDQRIKRGKCLIHQQDWRIGCQGTRQADTLLHATRQLCGIVIFKATKPHTVNPALGALGCLALGNALDGQAVSGILRYGTVRQKCKLLEHHRQLVAPELAQFICRHGQHILAIHNHFPLGRLDEPVDMANESRLAGTGQPHDHLNALFRDIDVDIAQAKHMPVFVQKVLFARPVADMRHGRGRIAAKHLVEITDLDLDVVSHGLPPHDAPAAAVHIAVIRGRK